VLGDPVYGAKGSGDVGMLHLHARSVTLPLYPNREPIRAEAPVPEHMRAALTSCGWPGESGR
jgi:tRNA pseudouridine32 synthase/23S rRNA pseudouridine746 synthase/23S rRNA pseudouridine1911/1915/1917 synthase